MRREAVLCTPGRLGCTGFSLSSGRISLNLEGSRAHEVLAFSHRGQPPGPVKSRFSSSGVG